MKILITGREGQIARSLAATAAGDSRMEIARVGRPELDLAQPETIEPTIRAYGPDVIISTAAYTAVDQAEDEPNLAFAVNAIGAGEVARVSAALGVPIVHLSTDYVFDGKADRPYREDDATGPCSIYGASKLAGEQAVATANSCHVILRTSWVYSSFGKNFVKTMLGLAKNHNIIPVVSDQQGNPTSAHDIADGILHIIQRLHDEKGFSGWGVYHLAGTGEATWARFAMYIFDVSRSVGGPYADVREIAASEFPTKARRPANSRLNTTSLAATFGWRAPNWRDSCRAVTCQLLEIDG